jgi:SH3 domain protein
MKTRLSIAIALTFLASMAPLHAADVAYVTDKLQLGLHRAADTSDRAFENLLSGARLEVLERNVNYARVRTDSGTEGWVKAAYIVSETPARYRVAELEAELGALRESLAEARAREQMAVDEAAALKSRDASSVERSESLRDKAARLERENAELAGRMEHYRSSLPMTWVLGALLLAFAAGGAAGWWTLDALSRRRHAGYRVY